MECRSIGELEYWSIEFGVGRLPAVALCEGGLDVFLYPRNVFIP
jgi:hypothetical protein